ncbi:SDR family NAD(P)-dependent oxidoreductase [Allonocardiopsis opalescens]|uniref:Ketoreductase domain-containing protein n=1 Tax=Allonocardiopsis opalescens TaxID=1144618 RepID=A0A2T0Q6J4_9ACTN|nr:SDR family oxidoreductase [Allonocardiopsis opalescens]PRX99435.1 hypothetical protein CLV72_10331 [Allonocardiopsis opalescens]
MTKGQRTALVTGASSGIGEEYARRLAERGHRLVLVARRAERLDALAAELAERYGARTESIAADLATAEGVARVEERLRAEEHPVDLLVNNAGYGGGGSFARQQPEDVQRVIDVNVTALVRLTRAVLPGQIERKRSGAAPGPVGVINVGSVAGLLPVSPGSALYASSKAFVRLFTESVAAEVKRRGVHVTAVLPGYVRTDMTTWLQEKGAPEQVFVPKETVVADSLRAFARGRSVVIPGLQYKAAGGLLKLLPATLVRGAVRRFGP